MKFQPMEFEWNPAVEFMNPRPRQQSCEGLTIPEVIVVMVILVILAGLLLPLASPRCTKAPRISCVNNLKQVGLAFRIWSNENDENFPWAVAVTNARPGTREFAESNQTWRHFQAISNELTSPKILACPSDTRQKVASWAEFSSNKHLSYFAGLDADETKPQTILSGDRNVTSTVKPVNGILCIIATTPVTWTKAVHKTQGNVSLADGSVQQCTDNLMNKQIEAALSVSTSQPVLRLALPE